MGWTGGRSKERKELEEAPCKLEMTPMIDVTFLLLIFFMCTLKFKTLEGAIGANLPKDVGTELSPGTPPEKAVIRLDVVYPGSRVIRVRDGATRPYTAEDASAGRRFSHGEDRVIEYRVGPRRGLSRRQAFEALRGLVDRSPDTKFSVDPREGVTQNDVVELLDGMLEVGIDDVTFVGSYER